MFLEKNEVKGMRGGEGSVIIEKAKELPMHCKMYARITILPSSSIGKHIHETDEEIVYVLKGRGKALVDDEYIDIKEGEVHLAKNKKMHSIINNTNEDLVILAVINE